MAFKDILDDKCIHLPIIRSEINHFPTLVMNVLRDYNELLIDFDIDREIIENLIEFKNHIFESIGNYYSG